MIKKITISITEARRRIFEISEEVKNKKVVYILTEHGKPKIALASAEDFELWEELIQDSKTKKRKADHEKIKKEERSNIYNTLENILSQHGLVVADKPKKGYKATGGKKNKKKK